ncbi:hypothetical protein [Undibacterium parvum]|uniref:hypothetical protein n=1 Tax=Undibacterium parvum TaxID=401471 RepID=UPI001476D672|nr:hypothetical protein [Undibacterium parvum]
MNYKLCIKSAALRAIQEYDSGLKGRVKNYFPNEPDQLSASDPISMLVDAG